MARSSGAARGGTTAPATQGPRTDPRVAASRERVIGTTLELLTEVGLGAVTVDDISKRSGVAKTTIYRHWPNRSALVVEACLRMTDGDVLPPDTGALESDLRVYMVSLAELLATARWSSILPSIVDVAEHDPAFADVHSSIQRRHAAPVRAILDRAVRRAEIPASTDLSAVSAALLGPLYYRRWFSREPLQETFVHLVIDGVLALIHGPVAK